MSQCLDLSNNLIVSFNTMCGAPTGFFCGKCDIAWVGFYKFCYRFFLVWFKGCHINNDVFIIVWGCRGVWWVQGKILCRWGCRSISVCRFVRGCRDAWYVSSRCMSGSIFVCIFVQGFRGVWYVLGVILCSIFGCVHTISK